MSMIERVARAIFTTWAAENGVSETWEEIVELGHSYVDLARKEARAALVEAYKPTEAMVEAGNRARMNIQGGYGGPGFWEAVSNAALNEQVTG